MDKEKCKEKFGFKELKKIVLFVGRIAPVKNLELLIKSFSIVEGKDFRCMVSNCWKRREKL
jgi:glycosyltransferase involved in cell wall biosynthesis